MSVHRHHRHAHVVATLKLGVSVNVDVPDLCAPGLFGDEPLSVLAQPAADPGVDLHEDRVTPAEKTEAQRRAQTAASAVTLSLIARVHPVGVTLRVWSGGPQLRRPLEA